MVTQKNAGTLKVSAGMMCKGIVGEFLRFIGAEHGDFLLKMSDDGL